MISLSLIIVAGILNSIMDTLNFHYTTSIFSIYKNQQWINLSLSWKNKWKNGDPKQGEKFLGSSTFLIFITDLWHLSKFLMLLFICAAIIFYKPLVNWWTDILIMYCSFTFIFELFFSKLLIKH